MEKEVDTRLFVRCITGCKQYAMGVQDQDGIVTVNLPF